MKFEEMDMELVKKCAACKSKEELFKLLSENHVELSDEQLAEIGGGRSAHPGPEYDCPAMPGWDHDYEYTGKEVPGTIWGDVWPNKEVRCKRCGYIAYSVF